jgi:hypothetical protein
MGRSLEVAEGGIVVASFTPIEGYLVGNLRALDGAHHSSIFG